LCNAGLPYTAAAGWQIGYCFLNNNSMYSAAEDNLVFAALYQRLLISNAHDALLHISNAAMLK